MAQHPCGCRGITHQGGLRGIYSSVKFCAMHAQAPALLERLKIRVKDCPCVGDSDFVNQERCEECVADFAAIAAAEGR